MDKKTWIIIAVILAAFAGLVGISIAQRRDNSGTHTEVSSVNYDNYDLNKIIPADENSGNIAEHVVGDPNAPLLLFEYADYQCEGCAELNPSINQLIKEYDGKVALVYRGYVLSYHPNGTAAASAANAAGLQGYWKEFKDLAFANQNEWYSASAADRQKYFETYFQQASNGKGDLAKFREDMASTAVAQKIEFDRGIADKVGLDWTPTLWLDGERIDRKEMSSNFLDNMRTKIDAKLAEIEKK